MSKEEKKGLWKVSAATLEREAARLWGQADNEFVAGSALNPRSQSDSAVSPLCKMRTAVTPLTPWLCGVREK